MKRTAEYTIQISGTASSKTVYTSKEARELARREKAGGYLKYYSIPTKIKWVDVI